MLDAIRAKGRSIGNLSVTAVANVAIGQLLMETNRVDESRQYIEQALKEAKESRNLYAHIACLAFLALIHYHSDEHDKTVSTLRETIELGNRSQMPMRHGSVVIELCWAMEQGKLPYTAGLS